ncbi:hypothetical protein BCR33DRAFT_79082 [Rhizoclosmatium globosum]|uniref:Uncharacterized protein n=1 Tax=Rhizoclosmatium globosum TaxID=329046 RepID=A0A1Y2CN57_9FUNG|nr:hypothetical protein BCR33DRAFT_79082 [Rhizoclosmatium globosum]|eukprot:ORY47775.1 hypothetical protein BCR33DRAFT_79082 [Rhizoclosmatium globosum]
MDLVNKLLQTKKSEQDRESRIRDKLEAAIDDKSSIIDKKNTQITERLVEMKGLKDIISRLEMQVKDEKLKVEKEISEKQAAISRVIQIQSEMEVQRTKFSKSKSEAAAHNNPSEDHELYKCKEQIKSLTRANDMYQKQAKAFEEAKLAAEIERDAVKVRVLIFSRAKYCDREPTIPFLVKRIVSRSSWMVVCDKSKC